MKNKIIKDYKIRRLINSKPPYESRKVLAERARAETKAKMYVQGLGDVEDNYVSDSHIPPQEESLGDLVIPSTKTILIALGIITLLGFLKFKS